MLCIFFGWLVKCYLLNFFSVNRMLSRILCDFFYQVGLRRSQRHSKKVVEAECTKSVGEVKKQTALNTKKLVSNVRENQKRVTKLKETVKDQHCPSSKDKNKSTASECMEESGEDEEKIAGIVASSASSSSGSEEERDTLGRWMDGVNVNLKFLSCFHGMQTSRRY